MVRIGIIGLGYWGPNIVRNFQGAEGCRVKKICDISEEALKRARRSFPNIDKTSDWKALASDPAIDAIAIATPVSSHFSVAKMALENGKHIFVEKAFTASSSQAEELIEIAERKHLKIMVDHTFLFTGAVKKMKELIDDGTLGSLCYYDSMRINLGLFQHDVNVIWDLAPHDLSIMDYVIREKPEAIVTTGGNHFTEHEYVAYTTMYFTNHIIAHLNVNWLSPVKVRTTLVGGEKKMLVWNDLEADEKIKVYDKGVRVENGKGVYDLLVSYRTGDVWAPRLEQTEALRLETQYFVDCITNGKKPFNDGHSGYRVVKMLEAADKSLKERGKLVYL
ncbi:MAG: Gfo/Idh/MocA family oxidoreductase [Syntrophobacteraceae bacterium]|jgi:predicted dehydrogenase